MGSTVTVEPWFPLLFPRKVCKDENEGELQINYSDLHLPAAAQIAGAGETKVFSGVVLALKRG